jgi:hypothetical protein
MASEKQIIVDELYAKYKKTLELLDNALDQNNALKEQLNLKPKEVEVEKIVEVEADINLDTPDAIAELERKVEQKMTANAEREE